MLFLEFLARWGHVLFGITWIGMLYYFNFVQGGYLAKATDEGKKDVVAKLVPNALWWFRWGAMFTFLTGLYLLLAGVGLGHHAGQSILLGALMGTLMFLNVWLIIWPNQQVVIGMKDGDAAASGAKALLASRTNTLFSAPMLFGMLASKHSPIGASSLSNGGSDLGFWLPVLIILALEANAIFGKIGPIATVKGVIHSSLALTAILFGLVYFL